VLEPDRDNFSCAGGKRSVFFDGSERPTRLVSGQHVALFGMGPSPATETTATDNQSPAGCAGL
jgi:hypothetical protein